MKIISTVFYTFPCVLITFNIFKLFYFSDTFAIISQGENSIFENILTFSYDDIFYGNQFMQIPLYIIQYKWMRIDPFRIL